jgi:hypothetical protein
MSEKDLIVDIVNRYGVDVATAIKIIETKKRAVTDTNLDRYRRHRFVNRLSEYQNAMQFA